MANRYWFLSGIFVLLQTCTAAMRFAALCFALLGCVLSPATHAEPVRGVYLATWEGLQALDSLPEGRVNTLLLAFLRLCGPHELAKDRAACADKPPHSLSDGATERAFNQALLRRKQREPGLKVWASVGGWGGSDGFFPMAATPTTRAAFVADALRYLREHAAVDGLDLDWEHPGGNGAANGVQLGGPADGANFLALLTELRHALDGLGREHQRRYGLSVAVNVTRPVLQRVDWAATAPLLDHVFMMSYDYHGAWNPHTGHHAALKGAGRDDSLEESVATLRAAGMPAQKLVAGAAFYGRAWRGVAGPKAGAKAAGPALSADGALGWRELATCCFGPAWLRLHDSARGADALWHPQRRIWISYESPATVRAKAQWAQAQGLGGVFAWEWTQDDGALLDALTRP